MFFYSQQYYSDFGLNKIEISIILVFIGGVACLGAILSDKIYHRYGEKIAYFGAFAIAVAYISYGLSTIFMVIGCLLVLFVFVWKWKRK